MMSNPFNNWPNDPGFDVMHEEREPVELQVSGTIPSYVSGTLYRTGPGGHQVKTDNGKTFSVDHWFDGFSQNHRFQIIQSGSTTRVIYNSRRSADTLIKNVRKTGKIGGFSFGQKRDPRESFFRKLRHVFVPDPRPFQDQHNIGVTLSVNPPGLDVIDTSAGRKKGGRASGIQSLWAKTDAAVLREINPETLEPMGVCNQSVLHPELTGTFSAAHANVDPQTGDLYNYNLSLGKESVYKVFRVSAATGKTDILATITGAPGAYVHSTLITENYFVLCVWSGHYAWRGAKVLWEHNMLDAIAPFDPSKKALWYVIDRLYDNGHIATYTSDPFFCFHTINAWEECCMTRERTHCRQVDIVAVLSIYKDLDTIRRFYYDNIRSTSPGSLDYVGEKRRGRCDVFLRRFRLRDVNATSTEPWKPLKAEIEFTAEPNLSCEFPTIDPRFLTFPSRYIYGVCDRGLSTFYDGIVKYDMKTHTATYWSVQGHTPSEPTFVPDPNGSGVLLSVVLDGFSEKSYLLVLDAESMKEIGRASMDCVVGFGFHGAYHTKNPAPPYPRWVHGHFGL